MVVWKYFSERFCVEMSTSNETSHTAEERKKKLCVTKSWTRSMVNTRKIKLSSWCVFFVARVYMVSSRSLLEYMNIQLGVKAYRDVKNRAWFNFPKAHVYIYVQCDFSFIIFESNHIKFTLRNRLSGTWTNYVKVITFSSKRFAFLSMKNIRPSVHAFRSKIRILRIKPGSLF